ncbi:MAG: Fe-S cluster assembly protein SufD [Dehalococcoidia bacterium]|nr:Fe-S cluster assembly protein SufD [Dehalococcoidia bacterium]
MTTTSPLDTYLTDFADAARDYHAARAGRDPEWIADIRAEALDSFRELGLPTARRGNEEYKYTDIRPLVRQGFSPLLITDRNSAVAAPDLDLDQLRIGPAEWHRVVIVDGRFAPELSAPDGLPDGIAIGSLAEGVHSDGDAVRAHLARLADYTEHGFTALNTALAAEGALVLIPRMTAIDQPIQVVYISTERTQGAASMPRTLVVAGEDSSAAIVETHVSTADDAHLTNAVTEIVVGAGSNISYCKIQQESEATYNVSTTLVEVNENANFRSMAIDIGGRLTRNNLTIIMAGEGGNSDVRGAYVITRDQHVDNQVIVDHVVGHNDMNEIYKGILDGHARSVFHGSIIVRPNAAKVNAMQVDKNLLLSNDAEADTKPAFWIYCDDVRCGHGAACGNLDEDAMFYLRSRGIEEEEARMMLIRAFVSEVVDAIQEPSIHDHVAALIATKLDNL